MSADLRRYDIDWLRVIAIALLLIYHVSIGFQPWGMLLGFITNNESLPSWWIPMAMLNVWRIPLLFFISGMGVFFALRNRTWIQLLKERGRRILVPFLVGIFLIVPLHFFIWQQYYKRPLTYLPNPSHLWFLGNILLYTVLLLPAFQYLKKNEQGSIAQSIKKVLSKPVGLLLILLAFFIEVWLLDPPLYELYAMTTHGFFLGLIAFTAGFCLVYCGASCWKMMLTARWLLLLTAVGLYAWRVYQPGMKTSVYLLVTESNAWIFSVLAFGYRHLNKPGNTLRYLSEAAYPVYIVHMIFLYLASMLLFPLSIAASVKYPLALLFTLAGSWAFYEWLIRRIGLMRILFGLNKRT